MKYLKFLLFLLTLMCFTSCDKNIVSFGTVEYYPGFLWKKSVITPTKKTFEFNFSLDAQHDSNSYAEFQFVDNNDIPISTEEMQVYDGTVQLIDNKLQVQSNDKSKVLTFYFSPDASNGKHQGYLKLISHNLDRIDSQPLKPGDKVDVFQWTLYYNKSMNPLAKLLLFIFLAIVACIIFWHLALRPALYPHFGKFKKSILIKQNGIIVYQLNYSFTGARKVIFYDREVKQSIWRRIFIGEIKTYVNPLFKSKLTFSPKRRGAAAFGTGYTVNPNPIPRNGVATINNHLGKISITLN